jgi:hypothetical protein
VRREWLDHSTAEHAGGALPVTEFGATVSGGIRLRVSLVPRWRAYKECEADHTKSDGLAISQGSELRPMRTQQSLAGPHGTPLFDECVNSLLCV